MKGPVALVTGSSRGLGRAIARELAAGGYTVVVHGGTDSPALRSALREVRRLAPASQAMVADLGDATAIRAMFAGLKRLDVLVNNAAMQNRSPFLDLEAEHFDRVLAVNLRAPFLCGQLAARLMRRRRAGKIINISSVHAIAPKRNFAHYSTSKGGLETLTRAMALELAADGIQVNSIVAGAFETEMTPAARQTRLLPAIPAGRIGQPVELARLVRFLSGRDCDYLTGASVIVDGGLTFGFCASRPDL
ncbi:MAG: 3-oxoacyl-(acyl-carrier-protein) reductase [Verrucomicrobia bacterium]|nr:3-oxoacyl-(acyl-carrier-protein) reductase [Verrucomicrobiota bacterium]